MHQAMSATMEHCVLEIRKIQDEARQAGKTTRPRWPMIVLPSPEGWTAPRQVDDHYLKGFWRAQQITDRIRIAGDVNVRGMIDVAMSIAPGLERMIDSAIRDAVQTCMTRLVTTAATSATKGSCVCEYSLGSSPPPGNAVCRLTEYCLRRGRLAPNSNTGLPRRARHGRMIVDLHCLIAGV